MALTVDPNLTESALDSVQRAVCKLEDDPAVNAGYGSNLTEDGRVECDAALMSYKTASASAFGSVAAVQGIRNPVLAARAVLEYSQRPKRLGRVAPLCVHPLVRATGQLNQHL